MMAYLEPGETKRLVVSLDDLISLQDAQVPAGTFVMRPLDRRHVEQLVESDPATWPEIEVTLCSQGYIVIDGYHRWEVAKIRHLDTLKAMCRGYASEQEIIEAAFQANLKHGLKANAQTRGDYAYWLHLSFPDLDQVEIAKRVGMTQGAVSKAITKRERLAKQMNQQEEPSEQTQQRVRQSCQQFTKRAIRFLDEVGTLGDEELLQIFQDMVKQEEKIKLLRLTRLLTGNSPIQTTEPLRLRQFVSKDAFRYWAPKH